MPFCIGKVATVASAQQPNAPEHNNTGFRGRLCGAALGGNDAQPHRGVAACVGAHDGAGVASGRSSDLQSIRRLWRQQNPQLHSAQVCAWQKKNIRKVLDRHKVWSKKKRQTDPNWKLKCYLRTRIYNALKGISKSASTVKLLGCSIENLWIHLESQFEEGMCRENYGTFWEVDHIIALALFDLTREEHQRRAFHFSNLQPLTIADNRSKGAKSTTTIERRG